MLIPLDQPLLIELTGSEAAKVLHNLTTNNVRDLAVGATVESFITDVRGWVVAHVVVQHVEPERWWLVGQHPDSPSVAAHIDRYVIREAAQVVDLSSTTAIYVHLEQSKPHSEFPFPGNALRVSFASLHPAAELVVVPGALTTNPGQSTFNSPVWDQVRIPEFWPRMGLDIWEKCIPQELNRTTQAISFTKGCYLGQETIARLDALGQVQKKLTLLRVPGDGAISGATIFSGEKEVGRVTSATVVSDVTLALAVIRRGFFDEGTMLMCGQRQAVVQKTPSHYA